MEKICFISHLCFCPSACGSATAPAVEALAWCHAMQCPASLTQVRGGNEPFVWNQASCESFFAPIIAFGLACCDFSAYAALKVWAMDYAGKCPARAPTKQAH